MPIKDAVTSAGGAAAVARQFGINPVSVYEWITKGRLPSDRVIPLAQLTGWCFTPHMLDVALYPNEFDGLPCEVRELRYQTGQRAGS